MKIREWKFEDILRLSELEKECFTNDVWSYQTLAACFENPNFFGAVGEENGEIVAYGGVTVAADEGDLETVAVAEDYRGCGNGGQIVAYLLEAAKKRGAEKLFLEVRVSNSAALGLYLKFGFKGLYARTRYYPDGEDCLVMVKTLK